MTRPTLRLASLALALVVTPGCLGTRSGHPDEIGSRNVQEFTRSDTAEPTSWRRVLIGMGRPKVRGYVKSLPVPLRGHREVAHIHFVYDPDFALVGRVSSNGETYRIDRRGDERHEGNFKLEHAVLLLLGAEADDVVKLASMPNPR